MAGEIAIVFDDDEFFRNFFADTLAELNLQVIAYSSHDPFLSQLSSDPRLASALFPDFILTDNQMPEMTGLEFLTRIEQMGCKLPAQRIGLISGRWDETDMEEARKLGCKILQKFNSPEQLQAWIEESRKSPNA